eukprot:tig00000254_g22568.t1
MLERQWNAWFGAYRGYKDHACKETFANLESGKGPLEAASESNELAGASRIAPLLYRFADKSDLDKLVQAARSQAGLTHGGSLVAPAAEFFARVAHAVLHGAVPSAAMRAVRVHPLVIFCRAELTLETPRPQAVETIGDAELREKVEQGLAAAAADAAFPDDYEAVKSLGVQEFPSGEKLVLSTACYAPYAVPVSVYFIAKYENAPDALKAALVANTAVGGDSAARGMLIGLVLGARQGPAAAVPAEWVSGLRSKPRIDKALYLATSGSVPSAAPPPEA